MHAWRRGEGRGGGGDEVFSTRGGAWRGLGRGGAWAGMEGQRGALRQPTARQRVLRPRINKQYQKTDICVKRPIRAIPGAVYKPLCV